MSSTDVTNASLMKRLQLPEGKIRMVLDTDTYNEIDDQFAVVYALKSPERLNVEAIYAAPFFNGLSTGPDDGIEKSYLEILKILEILEQTAENFAYRGSTQYISSPDQPVFSEAAYDLVERAMASEDNDPLYVVAIGAITNVASALLIEPRIKDKIVVVWLGGHALHWSNTNEFNLRQDIHASRIVLDSGVPLVLIPCRGVTSHLLTTLSEVRDYVKGTKIGDYLYDTFLNCRQEHFGYSRVIWDIATIGYLINENWVPSPLTSSPILTDQFTWSIDKSRHLIKCAEFVNRDKIFTDMFRKIQL